MKSSRANRNDQRRLLAVLAHPDDESLAIGPTLAKYAATGVETYLVTATRGERGWLGATSAYPGPTALGQLRQQELVAAAATLGLTEVNFLGYCDGEVDRGRGHDHWANCAALAAHSPASGNHL